MVFRNLLSFLFFCHFATATAQDVTFFNATVVFTVSENFMNFPGAKQQSFLDTFQKSYNDGNKFNNAICDPFERVFTKGSLVAIGVDNKQDAAAEKKENKWIDLLASFEVSCAADCPEYGVPVFGDDVVNMLIQNVLRNTRKLEAASDCMDRAPTDDEILVCFQKALVTAMPDVVVADLFEVQPDEEPLSRPGGQVRRRARSEKDDDDTEAPTDVPSEFPSEFPTEYPTEYPTESPTCMSKENQCCQEKGYLHHMVMRALIYNLSPFNHSLCFQTIPQPSQLTRKNRLRNQLRRSMSRTTCPVWGHYSLMKRRRRIMMRNQRRKIRMTNQCKRASCRCHHFYHGAIFF
mmetsp:Transcript_18499/g.33360  ORF Transcript_18499/g.33360 Transcript_18499/m.33360 type:complete len:348 (+) Transcript_18499:311-1354(+)